MDCNSKYCDNKAAIYVDAIVEIDGEDQRHSINLCTECYEKAMEYQKAKEKWR